MTGTAVTLDLDGFSGIRSDLIPILQHAQDSLGYITEEAVRQISQKIRITENEIYGVATFYSQFRFQPPGEHHIQVCMGTACHVKGGQQLSISLEYQLDAKMGETTADGKYDLEQVACLGCCALAPVVKIDETIHSQLTVLKLRKVFDEDEES
jgi:NADH-quinone oxidoreductase subunit E